MKVVNVWLLLLFRIKSTSVNAIYTRIYVCHSKESLFYVSTITTFLSFFLKLQIVWPGYDTSQRDYLISKVFVE